VLAFSQAVVVEVVVPLLTLLTTLAQAVPVLADYVM
jgi:hypothetical protein